LWAITSTRHGWHDHKYGRSPHTSFATRLGARRGGKCGEGKPRCRLWDVVYNFPPATAEERIEAWCATGGTGVDGEWSRAELEDHVRDEHSTFTWLLEPMIAQSGFDIEEAWYSEDGIFAQYVLRAT